MLAKLVDDLPADLPAASMARSTPGLHPDRRPTPPRPPSWPPSTPRPPTPPRPPISLHAAALIAAGQLDDAGRQLDRLGLVAPDDSATVTLRARYARARGKGSRDRLRPGAGRRREDRRPRRRGRRPAHRPDPHGRARPAPRPPLRVASLLLDKFPKTAGVKAAVLARQGRREEALKLYLKTIEAGDPKNVREAARNSLALITRDKFDPASIALAEKVIDAARLKDPTSTDLLAMAGYLRHYQGRYDDEIKIYEEALVGQPEDFALMNNLAWTLSEGQNKPEAALARINEAIKKSDPVPAQLLRHPGLHLHPSRASYDEAIRDLELAVRDRPTGLIWAHLARAYKMAGRSDDFEKARDRAKAAKPPLVIAELETAERAELEALIFGEGK